MNYDRNINRKSLKRGELKTYSEGFDTYHSIEFAISAYGVLDKPCRVL